MSEIETQTVGDLPRNTQPTIDDVEASATTEEPIDPLLLDKMAALKSIVITDKLLNSGTFPGAFSDDLAIAKEFLKNLHSPILKECQAHKDFSRMMTPKVPPNPAEAESIKKAKAKRNRKARRKAN